MRNRWNWIFGEANGYSVLSALSTSSPCYEESGARVLERGGLGLGKALPGS